MGNYDNIKGKGNRFTSENQPKNRGRKPKLYTVARDAYKVSKEEFVETATYVMQLPKEDARKLADKKDTPMWVALVVRSLYRSAVKGEMRPLLDLMKMMGFDAPTEVKVNNEGECMSREDILKELERLRG